VGKPNLVKLAGVAAIPLSYVAGMAMTKERDLVLVINWVANDLVDDKDGVDDEDLVGGDLVDNDDRVEN
jgi:hypothetical protein